jgi:hypothetical protein
VAAQFVTIQAVSRKCPIGHRVDILFENWTSSLRIYTSVSVLKLGVISRRSDLRSPSASHVVSAAFRLIFVSFFRSALNQTCPHTHPQVSVGPLGACSFVTDGTALTRESRRADAESASGGGRPPEPSPRLRPCPRPGTRRLARPPSGVACEG